MTISVFLLDGSQIPFVANAHTRVRHVFAAACAHLHLVDDAYFGLAQMVRGHEEFLDMSRLLSSYATRSQLPDVLFRVEFYVDNISLLKDPNACHLHFLQTIVDLHANATSIPPDKAVVLAALQMQATVGDYSPEIYQSPSFNLDTILPAVIMSSYPDLESLLVRIAEAHQELFGMPRLRAEGDYLLEAQVCLSLFKTDFLTLFRRWQITDPLCTLLS